MISTRYWQSCQYHHAVAHTSARHDSKRTGEHFRHRVIQYSRIDRCPDSYLPSWIICNMCRVPLQLSFISRVELILVFTLNQGSYRILTVVFQTFRGQNYFFFPTFRGTLFIFMWTKNITKLAFKRWNFLYNVFFYSKYRMGLKFLNSELQMLCVMNCKKINKCIGN